MSLICLLGYLSVGWCKCLLNAEMNSQQPGMDKEDAIGLCFCKASYLHYFQSGIFPLILPRFLKTQTTAAALSQRMVYESL